MVKITQLPNANPLDGSEAVPIVQDGKTRQINPADHLAYISRGAEEARDIAQAAVGVDYADEAAALAGSAEGDRFTYWDGDEIVYAKKEEGAVVPITAPWFSADKVGAVNEGNVQTALHNRRKSINVASYAYSRDGLIAAIDDAPADGATIWMPKGDYVIPSLFSFSKSNLTFEGEPGTRFIVDGAAVVLLRPLGTAMNPLSNITIRGIEFFDPDPEAHAAGADESHGIGAVYVNGLLIEDCVFTNIGDESVEINRCSQATARNLRFNGAAAASSGGGGVTISSSHGVDVDGCWFFDTILGQGVRVEIAEAGLDAKDIRIRGNWFRGQQALQAISVAPGLANVLGLSIIGNQFDQCATEAISMTPSGGRYVRGVSIMGNIVRGGGDLSATGAGAVRAAIYANSDRVQRVTITGNEVYDWGAAGADSAGHHGIAAWNAVISGNHLESCFDSGVVGQGSSLITGNRSVGNGLAATGGGRAGVQYGNGAIVRNNLIEGNYRGVHTRSAVTGGVIEDNTVTGNTIGIALNGANYSSRNRISGNTTGISMSGTGASTIDDILVNNTTNITDSGMGSIKRGRAPSEFVTKNNGTATVPSGETYVLVSHGLSNQTPGAKDISVTPTNNLGNASQFWVSNITSTGFRINVDVDPGGDATFAWQAEIQ